MHNRIAASDRAQRRSYLSYLLIHTRLDHDLFRRPFKTLWWVCGFINILIPESRGGAEPLGEKQYDNNAA